MAGALSFWWGDFSQNTWDNLKSIGEQQKNNQDLFEEKNRELILNKIWKNNDFLSKLPTHELKKRLDEITKLLNDFKPEEIIKLLNDLNDEKFLDKFNYKVSKEKLD